MTTGYQLVTVINLLVIVILGQGNLQERQLNVPGGELRSRGVLPYSTCSLKKKCTKNGGLCKAKGTCSGESTKGCSKGCSCCLPVPTVDQCAAKDGFCVETGDNRCNGTIKILHNSCQDHCTCCVPDKIECPEGFLMSNNSNQCFKMFTGKKLRTWEAGKSKCHSEGLVTARPSDDIAVQLRKDLIDQYGDVGGVWVGAHGGGANMVWRDGTVFRNDSTLLFGGGGISGGFTPDFCLAMLVSEFYYMFIMTRGLPYISLPCSSYKPEVHSTLCELIME